MPAIQDSAPHYRVLHALPATGLPNICGLFATSASAVDYLRQHHWPGPAVRQVTRPPG